jgi:hypothetical protein
MDADRRRHLLSQQLPVTMLMGVVTTPTLGLIEAHGTASFAL